MTQPANAFASHLINQTLSSIALLESLSIINSTDATLIRQTLPSPTGPFPSLQPSSSPSTSFANLHVQSPSPSWTVQLAQNDPQSQSQSQAQPHPQSQHSSIPALPPRSRPTESRARALWDFNGTEAQDLQFRGGDTIIIDEEVNDQWYRGRVIPNGHNAPLPHIGLFPSNYIEKLPPPPPQNYTSPPQQTYTSPPPMGPQAMVPYQQGPPQQYGYDQKQNQNQGQMQMMPPQQQAVVVQHQQEPQKSKYGKLGSQLGNAAVTGFGFGAGSAVAGEIVHAIF